MDVSIYDNYSGAERDFDFFFLDGRFKQCDSLLAVICIKGSATFKIRLHEIELKKRDFLIIGPDTPFYIKENSEDFKIDVIRTGMSIFEFATEDYLNVYLERLVKEHPLNRLSSRRLLMFHSLHAYLKILTRAHKNRYRDLVLHEYIKIFFFEVCYIMDQKSRQIITPKRDRAITTCFFDTVEANFKQNRKVEYYANEIGISPKHLAYVIKKSTGKYPSEWIEDYTILESKKLLRMSEDSIQEISFDLNFATPSHFTKFFKARTGMTPKEFRKKSIDQYEQ